MATAIHEAGDSIAGAKGAVGMITDTAMPFDEGSGGSQPVSDGKALDALELSDIVSHKRRSQS